MRVSGRMLLGLIALFTAVGVAILPPAAQQQAQQQQRRPNILFFMADDIGWMQTGIYHRGLMVGETPNIDRIGREGAQSCTSGRNAFYTGMYPLRTGLIPPQLPGSPSYLRPGTPAIGRFLLDFGYIITPASSARITWAITRNRCRPRMASRSSGAISITSTRRNR